MISLKNITKSFGFKTLFSDVNFSVHEKEKIGIMGRNGYGKSTLFRLILGEEMPELGTIEIPEKYTIRALEQHLRFEHFTVLSQVISSLPPHQFADEWRAKSVLMGLGFSEEDFSKSPFSFSSGYQVRIRLAEALVSECDLLLLDEPTNYLDIVSLRWLERFLQNWGSSFLLITHDISFMEKVITHSAIIHRGKIRKLKGNPQKLLDQIEKDEEVYEKTRVMQEKEKERSEDFIRHFRAGARSAGLVQSRIKMLEKKEIKEKLEKLPQIHFSFPALSFSGDYLLKAFNLRFAYEPDYPLLEKFCLEIGAHERVAIIGKNGKGKSTLLKLLAEKLNPQAGHLKKYHILTAGYFGQEDLNEWRSDTILGELLSVGKVTEQQARNVAASLLFTGNEVKKSLSSLSGGEKARVRLGKLMLSSHHLLLLDEPTNHLDIESVQKLIQSLEHFEGSLVIASHDERLLSRVATKLVVFEENSVSVFDGGYAEFLEKIGWGDEDSLRISNEKKAPSDRFTERKEMQRRWRWIENRFKILETLRYERVAKKEKLSFSLQKAIKKNDSTQIANLGKELKLLEEEDIKDAREEESLLEEQIEIDEALHN